MKWGPEPVLAGLLLLVVAAGFRALALRPPTEAPARPARVAPLPPCGLATWPDGQYTASARDLAKLLAAVMAHGPFEGAPLVAPGVVDRLTAPRVTGLDGLAAPQDRVGRIRLARIVTLLAGMPPGG